MKYIKIISVGFLILIFHFGKTQTFSWAFGIGGPEDDFLQDLKIDNDDNFFIAVEYADSINPDPANPSNFVTSDIADNILLAKYDSSGSLLWYRNFSDASGGFSNVNIALAPNGDIYMAGSFVGTVDFDPGPGIFNLTAPVSQIRGFILRLSASGAFKWAFRYDGTNDNSIHDIKIWFDNQIVIEGSFLGNIDFDPGPGTQNLSSTGSPDSFLAKYDSLGNYVWVYAFLTGGSNDKITDYVYDSIGNTFIYGQYATTLDFDAGPGTDNHTAVGSTDLYLLKYDVNMYYQWGYSLGSNGSEISADLKIDSLNNIYLTGGYSNTMDLDFQSGIYMTPVFGNGDKFVAKYDSSLNLLWAVSPSSAWFDFNCKLILDVTGKPYIFSGTYYPIDFDPTLASQTVTPVGNSDYYLAKYTHNGTLEWVKQSFGSRNIEIKETSFFSDRTMLSGGYFDSTAFLDPAGVAPPLLTPSNSGDVFIMKMKQDITGTAGVLSATNEPSLYPIPCNDDLFINTGKYIGGKAVLYNANGIELESFVLTSSTNKINMKSYATGAYFLIIRQENSSQFVLKKIIKQ